MPFLFDRFRSQKNSPRPMAIATIGPTIIATRTPVVSVTLPFAMGTLVLVEAEFVAAALVDVSLAGMSVLVNVLSYVVVNVVDCTSAETVTVNVSV
jgi:hypothetical protein